MKYVRINESRVVEIIEPMFYEFDVYEQPEFDDIPTDATLIARAGDEVPVSKRYHPDFVTTLVAVPDNVTVNEGDDYDGAAFTPASQATAVPLPTVVTMKQARLALLAAGKYKAVQDTIAGLGGDKGDAARIEWEFSPTVERESDLVRSLAAALDLDDAALDSLFAAAAKL